ncbi:hypothetical protein CPB85DRAFT_1283743 [Mucidula mucida]|nr:hypothetical protein CPB85DRAFT_1283743 [Mucidula mucida]
MRADSPPPRLPSPDIPYIPLNPPPRRSAMPARSCGDLRHKARTALSKTPSRSSLKPTRQSPPSTSRSLPPPSPPRSPTFKTVQHRRSLSFAVPYRSPPPSPTIAAAPPPVPPIPAFALNLSDRKPVLRSPPPEPIYHLTTKPRLPKPVAGMTCFSFFKARNASLHQARAVHSL